MEINNQITSSYQAINAMDELNKAFTADAKSRETTSKRRADINRDFENFLNKTEQQNIVENKVEKKVTDQPSGGVRAV